MTSSSIIHFSKKPRAILLAGNEAPRAFSLAELEAARQEGYERGLAEAAAGYEQKLTEYCTETIDSQRKTLEALEGQHNALISQVSHALPALAMEAIRRLVTVVQIDRETIVGMVDELVAQTNPGSGALEVRLSDRDLKLFEGNEERFAQKYPGIRFVADLDLQPGDCTVQSRFGVVDGRIATKLRNIEALLQ